MIGVECLVADKLHGNEPLLYVSTIQEWEIISKGWPAPDMETFEIGEEGIEVWDFDSTTGHVKKKLNKKRRNREG